MTSTVRPASTTYDLRVAGVVRRAPHMTQAGGRAATFALQAADGEGLQTVVVKTYGTLAESCVSLLREGENAVIEGDLIERVRTTLEGGTAVARELVAKRVWRGHVRLSAI
jgi:single-stranded DNA-binding protein